MPVLYLLVSYSDILKVKVSRHTVFPRLSYLQPLVMAGCGAILIKHNILSDTSCTTGFIAQPVQ